MTEEDEKFHAKMAELMWRIWMPKEDWEDFVKFFTDEGRRDEYKGPSL